MPWKLPRWLSAREGRLGQVASEWRQTVDAIEWPILVLDPQGRIARLNRAAQRLAALEFRELLGRAVGEVGAAQPWREIAEMARVVAGTRASLTRDVRGEDGKEWHATASFSAGGAAGESRIIVVARDVTAVARLEAQLRRAETMAAMGALVSGVAHQVRNPLFGISATVDALAARFGERSDLAPFVDTLRGEVERLGRLMRDLLDYGRAPSLDLVDADVADVVASAVRACAPLAARRQVAVRNEVERGLARLRLDPGRIAQAVENLLENALHHSPAGASVELHAMVASAGGSSRLELSIADDGPGIREEDLPRLFDPFFSRRQGGTGLGLCIVRRIAEAHGGAVQAGRGPKGGAVMTLSLPISSSRAGGQMPAAVALGSRI